MMARITASAIPTPHDRALQLQQCCGRATAYVSTKH